MKAKTFRGKTDHKHRIVIPYANIKRLSKKLGIPYPYWEDMIVECEIKALFLPDGKVVKF